VEGDLMPKVRSYVSTELLRDLGKFYPQIKDFPTNTSQVEFLLKKFLEKLQTEKKVKKK